MPFFEDKDEINQFPIKGTFALPSTDIEELLDFIEDMILMNGCPNCESLNTKIIETDIGNFMICLDCGYREILPPPN